jgi:hypothetical protein
MHTSGFKILCHKRQRRRGLYTPREVIKLIVEILSPKPGESVYDPAWFRWMLITSYDHIKNKTAKSEAQGNFFSMDRKLITELLPWQNELIYPRYKKCSAFTWRHATLSQIKASGGAQSN